MTLKCNNCGNTMKFLYGEHLNIPTSFQFATEETESGINFIIKCMDCEDEVILHAEEDYE